MLFAIVYPVPISREQHCSVLHHLHLTLSCRASSYLYGHLPTATHSECSRIIYVYKEEKIKFTYCSARKYLFCLTTAITTNLRLWSRHQWCRRTMSASEFMIKDAFSEPMKPSVQGFLGPDKLAAVLAPGMKDDIY